MGLCQQCIHFRRSKPASQLLAQAANSTDAAIGKVLSQVQENESQQKGYEAQYLTKKDLQNDERWDYKPAVMDFCGLREAEEIYLITKIKNFGERCTDWKAGRPEKHSCDTCGFQKKPAGESEDAYTVNNLLEQMNMNAAVGTGSSLEENQINKLRENFQQQKAVEISGAYFSQGRLLVRPRYLSYCLHYSEEDSYVICALQNPHSTCAAWKQAEHHLEQQSLTEVEQNKQLSSPSFQNKAAESEKQPPLIVKETLPGELDTSFGQNGIATIGLRNGVVNSLVVQADGKIWLAGYSDSQNNVRAITVARFLANGHPDPSFGKTGCIRLKYASPSKASALAIQKDGRVLVAGKTPIEWMPGQYSNMIIVRLHTDGTLDTSFGSNGVCLIDCKNPSEAYALAIQPDGKVLVGGESANKGVLARLTQSGVQDFLFGTSGVAMVQGAVISALVLQKNGNIVAAGAISDRFGLMRFDDRGRLDSSFGRAGMMSMEGGQRGQAFDVTSLPDGRIMAIGSCGNSWPLDKLVLLCCKPDGNLDPSFGRGGLVITELGAMRAEGSSLIVQPDGKVVFGGGIRQGSPKMTNVLLGRSMPEGLPDQAFGKKGILPLSYASRRYDGELAGKEGGKVALQPNGKILVTGNDGSSGDSMGNFVLSRHCNPGFSKAADFLDAIDHLQSADILVENPGSQNNTSALTKEMVDQIIQYFEILLEINLGYTERALLYQSIIQAWQEGDLEAIHKYLQIVKEVPNLLSADSSEVSYWRETKISGFLQEVQKNAEENEAWQAVYSAYQVENRPIAPGNITLTRKAVDAYLKYLWFGYAVIQKRQISEPNQSAKDNFFKAASDSFPKMPAESIKSIASMPLTYAYLQTHWKGMPDQEKATYLESWSKNTDLSWVERLSKMNTVQDVATAGMTLLGILAGTAKGSMVVESVDVIPVQAVGQTDDWWGSPDKAERTDGKTLDQLLEEASATRRSNALTKKLMDDRYDAFMKGQGK